MKITQQNDTVRKTEWQVALLALRECDIDVNDVNHNEDSLICHNEKISRFI